MSAFILATICTICFSLRQPIADFTGLLDHPTGHKQHTLPTPVLGGVIIWVGFLLTYFQSLPLPLTISCIIVTFVGLFDDRFSLHWFTRFLIQGLAAVILIQTGTHLIQLGNIFNTGIIQLHYFCYSISFIAFMSLINGHNMLDGIDGLFASCCISQLLLMCILSHTVNPVAFQLNAGLIICFFIFLIWNLPKHGNAKIFMGDQGTYAMGIWNTYWAITLTQQNHIPPVIMLWVLMWPIFEMMLSTTRRAYDATSPIDPDRNHMHHLLQSHGISPIKIA
ncbi:MAG: hypothetical protein CMF41_04535, partial [Legionellales bacterium]